MGKRKIRIMFSSIVFLISVIVVITSNTTPKISLPFNSISPTSAPEEIWIKRSAEEVLYAENQAQLNNAEVNSVEISAGLANTDKSYKVAKVVDGDTIDVNIDGKTERLRMIGIDTPETVDPRKSVQCFGVEASNKAKEILLDKFITLESDPTQGEIDKYGRLLRYAFLPDGTNFGLFMISEGYAHEYTYRLPYKYQAEFKQAEIDARENNRGLWSPDTCLGKP